MAKARIMVVEDEGIIAEDIKSSLINMGYEVPAVVSSGKEAIRKSIEIRPDLVLMDIMLRDKIDGIDAAGVIRSGSDIPVIYLTAYADGETLKRAKITEPYGYIIKPFEARELHCAVEIALYKHRMEMALADSQRKYQALFENATDAIYLIDPETLQIIDCNYKASEITGYTLRELKAMTIEELHPGADQDVVSSIFRKITDTGSLSDISGTSQLRKDGKLVPVEINATIFQFSGRKHCLGIFRDISERKRAEDKVRYEKDKLVSILNAMEDGVFIVNSGLEIEYVNPVVIKEFGHIWGLRCVDYFHDGNELCPICKNRNVFTDKNARWEWTCSKNRKTYDVIDTPLKNPDGSISKLTIFRDISGRKKLEEKLQEAAITDYLTGLLNRRGFSSISEQQFKLAGRTGMRMTLLYLDIDNMKTINDELGHKTGDEVLTDTANILRKTFRSSDIIARIGGDEFAVLLTDVSETDTEIIIVNNLRKKLQENLTNHNTSGKGHEISLSIGIAYYNPDLPCSINELLDKADKVMYEIKKQKIKTKAAE